MDEMNLNENKYHFELRNALSELYNKRIQHLFFVGIGGSSMSGLAEIAKMLGFDVCGSDMCDSFYTNRLRINGIFVAIGHQVKNLPSDTDLLVYSAAIQDDNPERVHAKELGIPEIERSAFLGLLSSGFSQTVAVSGTHGKTTTSAMITSVLLTANRNPSVSIGGYYSEIGGNYRTSDSDVFVVEACEYRDSFLELSPRIGVITNIELEHLDYFNDGLAQMKDSFRKFGQLLPEDGTMIYWGDSPEIRDVTSNFRCHDVTFGFNKGNDWYADEIVYDENCCTTFNVFRNAVYYGRFSLRVPGEFNVLNALATIAVCAQMNINADIIQSALKKFSGVKRRFEFNGQVNGITVYEDYAHHPTELRAVLQVARYRTKGRLWVVFQAHTYSRVYYFFDAFVEVLGMADNIILNQIYSDREKNTWNVHIEDLAKEIQNRYEKPVCVCDTFDEIVQMLIDGTRPGDFVLIAGSQTINAVAPMFVSALKDKYGL